MKEMAETCIAYGAVNWIVPSAIQHFCWTIGELGISAETVRSSQKVENSYEVLADEVSKKIFRDVFEFMTLSGVSLFNDWDRSLYYAQDLHHLIDYTHFIDVGIFDGDSFNDWIDYTKGCKSCSYTGFDLLSENYEYFVNNILSKHDNSSYRAYNYALGDVDGTIQYFDAGKKASFVDFTKENQLTKTAQMRKLDSISLSNASVIKADIEGAEMAMLRGATETISKFRPSLLIAAYHRQQDIMDIPLWIHDLNLDYKIYLRRHGNVHSSTVCYAIPDRVF